MTITVNSEIIPDAAIAAEAAEHGRDENALHTAAVSLTIHTLLRQRADAIGIPGDDEDSRLDTLFAQEIPLVAPTQEACKKFYEENIDHLKSDDLFECAHILFAMSDATEVDKQRALAEKTLDALKTAPNRFTEMAEQLSNCPSAELGGSLGQISKSSVVPEFWSALAAHPQTGLLPTLLESRYGLHIVRIDRYVAGETLPYEAAAPRIANYLNERARHQAIQDYIRRLAQDAVIEGIDLGRVHS